MANLEKTDLNNTLLSELLEGKDDVFKGKILDLVVQHGLNPDDPLFHFLLSIDYLQIAYEEAPLVLDEMFEQHRELLDKAVEESTAKAIAIQNQNIRVLTEKLMKDTSAMQLKNPTNIWLGSLLFALVFSFGVGSGIGGYLGLGQFFLSGYKITTNQEAEDLIWVRSKEGKYARDLYEKNRVYLESGNCQTEAQQQGVRLTINGTDINDGICVLVIPPLN